MTWNNNKRHPTDAGSAHVKWRGKVNSPSENSFNLTRVDLIGAVVCIVRFHSRRQTEETVKWWRVFDAKNVKSNCVRPSDIDMDGKRKMCYRRRDNNNVTDLRTAHTHSKWQQRISLFLFALSSPAIKINSQLPLAVGIIVMAPLPSLCRWDISDRSSLLHQS